MFISGLMQNPDNLDTGTTFGVSITGFTVLQSILIYHLHFVHKIHVVSFLVDYFSLQTNGKFNN